MHMRMFSLIGSHIWSPPPNEAPHRDFWGERDIKPGGDFLHFWTSGEGPKGKTGNARKYKRSARTLTTRKVRSWILLVFAQSSEIAKSEPTDQVTQCRQT